MTGRNGRKGKALFLLASLLAGAGCVYGATRLLLDLAQPELMLRVGAGGPNGNLLTIRFANTGFGDYTLDLSRLECFALIRTQKNGEYTAYIRNRPEHSAPRASPPVDMPPGKAVTMFGVLPDRSELPDDCTRVRAAYSVHHAPSDAAWRGAAVSYAFVLAGGG